MIETFSTDVIQIKDVLADKKIYQKLISIEEKLDLLLSKDNKTDAIDGNLSGLTTDI